MKTSVHKNQGSNQSLNKEQINNSTTIPFKKIRIIVSDPYATDSSSDEYERRKRPNNSSPKKPRKIIKEIIIPNDYTLEKSSTEGSSENDVKKYRGIRRRKSGAWSAEIRDPIKKRKVHLGSFGTAEEASRVFEAKKVEFRERQEAQLMMDLARPGCGSGTDSSGQSGEGEQIGEGRLEFGSILIDNNGFLLGEFSNLDDDLKIPE